ncbi:MAG: hypothetical protein AB7G47_19850 [Mycolicibacterium sp.]|uniref:hypothetical protein n=1 Tax=Mycolicibacterium sp. TaxID=2320850 RepID=UPI003D09D261
MDARQAARRGVGGRVAVRFRDRDDDETRTWLAWPTGCGRRWRVMGRFGLVDWDYDGDELEPAPAPEQNSGQPQ